MGEWVRELNQISLRPRLPGPLLWLDHLVPLTEVANMPETGGCGNNTGKKVKGVQVSLTSHSAACFLHCQYCAQVCITVLTQQLPVASVPTAQHSTAQCKYRSACVGVWTVPYSTFLMQFHGEFSGECEKTVLLRQTHVFQITFPGVTITGRTYCSQ